MFQYPDFEQPNQFHLQQLIHSLDGNPRLVGMVQKSGVGGGQKKRVQKMHGISCSSMVSKTELYYFTCMYSSCIFVYLN